MSRWITLAVALALAAALAGCAGAPRPAPPPPKPPKPDPAAGAKVVIPGGTITIPDPKGGRLWEASADVLEWDGDHRRWQMRGVVCNFLENGQVVLSAQAPSVSADTAGGKVVLSQGVEARSQTQHSSFRADRAEWTTADRKVYATGNVKLVRVTPEGASTAVGERLVADTAFRHVSLQAAPGRRVRLEFVEPTRRSP